MNHRRFIQLYLSGLLTIVVMTLPMEVVWMFYTAHLDSAIFAAIVVTLFEPLIIYVALLNFGTIKS